MNQPKNVHIQKIDRSLFLLLGVAFPLIYFQLFKANFISWDDAEVLLKNKDVHGFHLKAFFTKHYVGNYAPITMMSFALDWFLFHGSAFWHHTVNVFLHLINAVLVFILIRKVTQQSALAFLVALIFSFHPTQIETIAWVAAKNNLVYALFFLLGLISYVNYMQSKQLKFYLISLLLFLLSVLSKPSAICFPLCLLLVDYCFSKEFSVKAQTNKIPFFLIAIAIGIVTIFSRTEDKFINESHAFAMYERIGYAGYALLQYVIKFLFPVNLSVIYPYPSEKTMSLILGYVVWAIGMFACYKLVKQKKFIFLFGILFFIINLLLVLQFIPFGEVLTADRYMYLPIIGLALVLFSLFKLTNGLVKIVGLSLVIVLGFLSFKRSMVWKNSISLYSDIIEKYPHSFLALNSLGAEYMLNKNYTQAETYLNKAIAENTNYYKGYYNRGLLYAQTNRMPQAIDDFTKAIDSKKYLKAYVARANAYYVTKDFTKAIRDAEEILKLDNNNAKANFVLATCYDDLNQLDKAFGYYNRALVLNPDDPMYYMRRAILFGKQKNFAACLNDLNRATEIDANFSEAYYWKGVVKVNLHQNPCSDLKQALQLGFEAARQPLMNYCR